MKIKFKSSLFEITFNNKWILIINLFVFLFVCGTDLSTSVLFDLNIFEYVILCMSNHYYIIYCMFPIITFVISIYLRDSRDIEKIRYKTKSNITVVEFLKLGLWVTGYLFIHFAIVFIIGLVFLRLSPEPFNIINGSVDSLGIVKLYEEKFGNTIISILFIYLYMNFGFFSFVGFIVKLKEKYSSHIASLFSLVGFINVLVAFKTNLYTVLPFLFLNNYIIFHHAFFVNTGMSSLLTLLCGLIIILYTTGLIPRFRARYSSTMIDELVFPNEYKKYGYLSIGCLLLLNLLKKLIFDNYNSLDIVMAPVFGSNGLFFSMINIMSISIFYFTPLFIIGRAISNSNRFDFSQISIRYIDRNKISQVRNKNFLGYTVRYFSLFAILYLLGFISGFREIPASDYYWICLESGINAHQIHIFGILILLILIIQLLFNHVIYMVLVHFFDETISFVLLAILTYASYMTNYPLIKFFGLGIIDILTEVKDNWILLAFKMAVMIFVITTYNVIKAKGGLVYDRVEESIEKI